MGEGATGNIHWKQVGNDSVIPLSLRICPEEMKLPQKDLWILNAHCNIIIVDKI